MKKAMKKLALAKETLRSLSLAESAKVAGGTTGGCGTGYCGGGSGVCSVQCWSDPQYSCQNEFTPETYSSAC
jgi:hypothetical protein